MTRSLHVFDALEPKFTPFKFVPCVELTLQLCYYGVCSPSKTLYCASARKSLNAYPHNTITTRDAKFVDDIALSLSFSLSHTQIHTHTHSKSKTS